MIPPIDLGEPKITFYVRIITKNNKPALQISRILSKKEQIGTMVDYLLKKKKIIAEIKFKDELMAYSKIKETFF